MGQIGFRVNRDDDTIIRILKHEASILEQLRKKIGDVVGVTLAGNRLTVRWNDENERLVDVHLIVISTTSLDDYIAVQLNRQS